MIDSGPPGLPASTNGAAMNRRAVFVILIAVVAAGAMAFRLPKLTLRPMHCDEAVHAYKFGQLLERNYYRYDPVEYHGPTLNYLTLPVAWLSGAGRCAEIDESTLRIVPVVFGTATVLLLLLLGDGLGLAGAVCAAVLTAVSTAMVYYSRYYIQEPLLVCFALAALVGAWRFIRSGSVGWCVLAGVAVGLMHATKETWVFMPTAAGVAMLGVAAWGKWVDRAPLRVRRHVWNWRVAVGAAAGVVVACVLLSSFFTNPAGPIDSIRTYVYNLSRAGGGHGEGGNLHLNPWDFYLRTLAYTRHLGRGPIWSEGLILVLAVAGAVAGFTRRGLGRADARLVRFLAIYSAMLLAIYSAVPYKTPWCVLGPLHGMILLAGVGAVAIVRWLPWRAAKVAAAILLAVGAAQLGCQAYRANFRFYCSNYNPYVYAHSLRGVVRLGERAEEIAALHPDGHAMRIHVITPDPHDIWPLPWYLRRFDERHIGYYSKVPDKPDAPIVIFTTDVWEELKPKLKDKYQFESRGLRPAVVLWVGIRADLWRKRMDRERARLRAREKAMSGTSKPSSPPPSGPAGVRRFSRPAMACVFEVRIAGGDEDTARGAAEAAFEELKRIEKELSRFNAYGDVGRINAAAPGERVPIGIEAAECLSLARRIWQRTGGAFDVTAAKRETGDQPSGSAAAPVSMALLTVDANAHVAVRTDPRVRLDLGGIGKGYALDRMAGVLREWEVASALLHGGASTALAVGRPPGKAGWRLALRDPSDDAAEAVGRVLLADRALSGSATTHARHIVDPRTGRAVPADRAAWALAASAAEADALSTALCVMEIDDVRRYARDHLDVSCLVAAREGSAWRIREFGPSVLARGAE